MATVEINTKAAGYQNRLTTLTEIIQFYKPILDVYLALEDEEKQRQWRQADPLLKRLVGIWYYISQREET